MKKLRFKRDSYRTILKRVGAVLIVVGSLDTALMLYYLSQDQNYSSNFYIYAVIAGIFLVRGDLRAIPVITWVAAFFSSIISTELIVLPFSKPAELWATEFRLYPVSLSTSLLVKIATVALLVWVYTQLRTASVVSATLKSGYSASTPKLAFILGVALVTVLTGIMHLTLKGEAAAQAVKIAQAQHGKGYKYHVIGMRWDGGYVKANVIVYNEQEIKPVQVEW